MNHSMFRLAAALGLILAAAQAYAQSAAPETTRSGVVRETERMDGIIERGSAATEASARAQVEINQLDDSRGDMEREYRALLQRRDAAKLYVEQQQRVVNIQNREMASMRDQLNRIDEIRVQLAPMMRDMQAALFAFRDVDLPFKVVSDAGIDLRAARFEQLRGLTDRADVSPGERYRLLLEAFQAEMEYGNVVDAYRDEIEVDGETKTVDVFRFGRVAMVYLSEDHGEAGRWNRVQGRWEKLPSRYAEDFVRAIRIAENVAAPAILMAPVERFAVE